MRVVAGMWDFLCKPLAARAPPYDVFGVMRGMRPIESMSKGLANQRS